MLDLHWHLKDIKLYNSKGDSNARNKKDNKNL